MTPFFLSRLLLLVFFCGNASNAGDVPVYQAELLSVFDVPIAKQGVAVDGEHFYVVDKRTISKHVKRTGETIAQWPSSHDGNPLLHMDSLMEYNGKLYASHSNYPISPMTSSIEVWDARTLHHVATHSLGVNRGSLTWLDRHNGSWWGAFANYDKVQRGQAQPYGLTDNTQIVRFDENFNVVESWVLPQDILDRMRPMSNSGGSWGPDGYLYLTGHDHGEIYVLELPQAGSILHQVALVKVPVMEGQGIAWDRSGSERQLWGINKQQTKVAHLQMPEITNSRAQDLPQSSRHAN